MPIFISYSFKDKDVYQNVVSVLQDEGFECWDTEQMKLATSLSNQLRQAIRKCDVCIFIATKNSTESAWCAAETGAFWGARKKVYVLQADPIPEKDELPPPFREDLRAIDIHEIIKDIRKSGIVIPDYKPAVLFFFSS